MLALGPMGASGPEQGMIAARPVCPVDRYAPESLMTIEFSVTNNVFARDILTVAQLNQAVGRCWSAASRQYGCAEISNFTQAASGHWYFTIRTAAPPCGRHVPQPRQRWGSSPRWRPGRDPGARVAVRTARRLPVQVDAMRRAGWATCTKPFCGSRSNWRPRGCSTRRAKARLAPLRAIGVITSLRARCAGVLSALARRAPQVPVIIYPAPVQGADAATRLAASAAGQSARRSGYPAAGARRQRREDLWSFNDERWRAGRASAPFRMVSGVGHETDFTIVDFVADLRPPRPRGGELACTARRAAGPRHGRGARWRGQQRPGAAQRLDAAPPANGVAGAAPGNISASA